MKPTAWHIAQPYYADGIQECIVLSFGGNAHVNKPTPGSRRHDVNSLRIFEFGNKHYIACTPCLHMSDTSKTNMWSYFGKLPFGTLVNLMVIINNS